MLKNLFLAILFINIAIAQEYVINTYDIDSEGFPKKIKLLKIDLDNKTIVTELLIGDEGQILNKNPISITRQNTQLLVTAVLEKCYCDNTTPGMTGTRITIVDGINDNILHSSIDQGMIVIDFKQVSDSSIYINGESQGDSIRKMRGDYSIDNNFRFKFVKNRPENFHPDFFPGIERFDFFETVSDTLSLFNSVIGNRRFLLKTDVDRSLIIDSLEINNTPFRNIIMGITDSLIYIFHQNYEFYSKFTTKTHDDDRIQSCVQIFNLVDFALIDSLDIPDYPEGEYISAVFDVADRVGNYLVYYNFDGQGLEKNAPAMLFIFDTRTNEATWLRVGWR